MARAGNRRVMDVLQRLTHFPDHVPDKQVTVLAVQLDGPIDLYRESGR